jgi:hypothetical protein
MQTSTGSGHALGAIASIALLAGCSGGGASMQSVTPQYLAGQSLSENGIRGGISGPLVLPPGARMPAHSGRVLGPSYIACGNNNLLFLSDAQNNQILIFAESEENAAPCGAITGSEISQPQGIDTDRFGNLFVANEGDSNILKFKPPYTGAPVKINDPGQFPIDVATDCGNRIWVTNIIGKTGNPGSLTAYTLTGKNPLHTYTDPNASREYFVTCDPTGNVFTSFLNGNVAGVSEFKKPAFVATDLANVSLQFPGGVRWTGGAGFFGSLYVDDQTGLTIQKCSGGTGTCKTVVDLTGALDPVTFDLNYSGDDFFTADARIPGFQVWDLNNTRDATITTTGTPIGIALYPDNRP